MVADNLVYAAEIDGFLHCFDARTGQVYWHYDFKSLPWGAPLWVDGKIYLGTDDGEVLIFTAGKKKPEPKKIEMASPIRTAPIFANGVLYIATETRLFAIQEKK